MRSLSILITSAGIAVMGILLLVMKAYELVVWLFAGG